MKRSTLATPGLCVKERMMNNRILVTIFLVAIALGACYAPPTSVQAGAQFGRHEDDSDFSMPVQEQETIQKTFSVGGAHKLLDVDNVYGSIEVVGGQSDQVQLVVNKSIHAESSERMEAAKKEVTLDITDQPDLLKLYVNGPFRCNCNCDGDGCCGGSRRVDQGYVLKMDFQLQVPRNMDLKLRTVNSGRVNVRDVMGSFSVHNVNGGIEMQDVGGGKALARTVNGGVKVVFRENPKEDSDFGSINGPVERYFTRGLSADFRFKT